MKRGWWILKGIILVALMVVIVGTATMLLWNWLVPALFNGPRVTVAQAIGLLLLSKILFWTVGKGGRHVSQRAGSHWRSHLKEKWSTLTPEERKRLKEKISGKWCGPKSDSSGSSATV